MKNGGTIFLAVISLLLSTCLVNKTDPESANIIKTNLVSDHKQSNSEYPVPYKVKDLEKDAIKLDRADTDVKLTGKIIDRIDSRHYWFEDDTGPIIIDIRGRILPSDDLNDETVFIIIGEIDYDYLDGSEIEVEQIMVFTEE
jgi:uncharacterized protein (TIGR00156 family)